MGVIFILMEDDQDLRGAHPDLRGAQAGLIFGRGLYSGGDGRATRRPFAGASRPGDGLGVERATAAVEGFEALALSTCTSGRGWAEAAGGGEGAEVKR